MVLLGKSGEFHVGPQRRCDDLAEAVVDEGRPHVLVGRFAEISLGDVVQKVPRAVEGRRSIDEEPCRQSMGLAGGHLIQTDSRLQIVAAEFEGDPLAVVRPGIVELVSEVVGVDQGPFAVVDIHEVEGSGLVHVGQTVGLRRPAHAHAIRSPELAQTAGISLAITRSQIDLVLAGLVAEVGDPLAVRAPGRIALGHPGTPGEIDRDALFRRQRPDVPAHFHERALAGVGNGHVHQPRAHVLALGHQTRTVPRDANRNLVHAPAAEIEDVDRAPFLEHDLALSLIPRTDARHLDVIVGVVGDLTALPGARVVDPEIPAVLGPLVTQVVDLLAVPHRLGVGPLPVRDPLGGPVLQIVEPEIGAHATAVTLPGPVVPGVGCEGQPPAVVTDRGHGAVEHRQAFGQSPFGIDEEELWIAPRGAGRAREVQQPAIAGPLLQTLPGRMVGHAVGNPSLDVDHVDVRAALVVADEGDPAPVGTEARTCLRAGGGRQRRGQTAGPVDAPEIAGVVEHDPLGTDGRIADHPAVGIERSRRGPRCQGQGEQERQDHGQASEGSGTDQPRKATNRHLGHTPDCGSGRRRGRPLRAVGSRRLPVSTGTEPGGIRMRATGSPTPWPGPGLRAGPLRAIPPWGPAVPARDLIRMHHSFSVVDGGAQCE